MADNLVPPSMPMESIHMDQLETAPNTLVSSSNSLMESEIDLYSAQQRPMQSLHFEMLDSGLSDLRSQMLDNVSCANNMMPVSSYEVPLLHSVLGSHISHNTNMIIGQNDSHLLHKVQGQTDSFENKYRDVGPMLELPQQSIPTKRRTPLEIPTENKRMLLGENRPWLQPPATKHHAPITSPSSSAGSPRMRSATATRAAQAASSPKESFDSVRIKLRESLASALAIAVENKSKLPGFNSSDAAAEVKSATRKEDLKEHSTGKDFPRAILPVDDVSYSDSFFVKDELLQGNGLSWVMESEAMLIGKKGSESGIFPVFGIEEDQCKINMKQVEETPEILASKIEEELFKLFKGVNKKYKEKGRSLLFNLKDRNNPELGERVLSGEITPERLCSMSAEELASKELSQWRMAKEKEFEQMVVISDSDVDLRRLVKKTHKGEVPVELEEPQTISSLATNDPQKPKPDPAESYKLTIPSTEGSDTMEGLMGDDELKDADFPPIVSLDEFMESLNSEPPFHDLPKNADRPISKELKSSESKSSEAHGNKESKSSESQGGKESKSSESHDPKKSKPESVDTMTTDAILAKPEVDKTVKSAVKKPSKLAIPEIRGERVWDGLLQLNVSALIHVVGVFRSGEKTCAKEWPCLIEVKGRVRLEAFGKFLQELPLSRSRAVMALNFVCKAGTTESDLASVREVAESYVADERVGFAEPIPGVELYVCPSHGKTKDMLRTVVRRDQIPPVDDNDNHINGLIGVVVWRKVTKHVSKRQRDKPRAQAPPSRAPPPKQKPPSPDQDDDVPPGFGPPVSGDEDDLPEFNFSTPLVPSVRRPPEVPPPLAPPSSRPVDEIRQLIHKYGQSESSVKQNVVRSWKDDDDDMPEWRPPPLLRPHGFSAAHWPQSGL